MSQKTVLIVDDNKLNRAILCKILQSAGYNTMEAENGLIKTIPIIVMTGNDDSNAEILCLEKGASDFLKKPYNAELVIHRVQSLMRLWNNAALLNRVEVDHLTGLYSREFFYQHVEEVLSNNPDKKYYIVYSDIDDFKMINAKYGTEAGDELLKYIAGIYQKQTAEDGVCGHLGADTFIVLTSYCPHLSQSDAMDMGVREFSDAPVRNFQMKFGIYPVTDRSVSVSDMCDRAKLAEETVKHQYGMYFAVYNDSMRQHVIREHQLSEFMEDALKEKQFLVYLQPKHCTDTRAIVGAEALVRWSHPEFGFISPGDFIPVFERNGFITKLDNYMLTEVCRILKEWRDEGIPLIPISVNVSRADFIVDDLPAVIEGVVDSFGIPHDLVHLEVTESAYAEHPQEIISAVSTLRDNGFLIEMDDFGSGYSSLNMLSELPIDMIKLDMRFMQRGNERMRNGKRNVLSFVVSLAKWLQLPSIAEGVETQEEYEQLRTMGCDMIQGYYFAKPMPAGDFVSYMDNHPSTCMSTRPQGSDNIVPDLKTVSEKRPFVVVAEDMKESRDSLCQILEPYYNVAGFDNGRDACEYLQEHVNDVSCLILDLLMPIMDGFQVLEKMGENGMIREIPVIITTETGSQNEIRALHMGADSFVAKPYNDELMLHQVQKTIEEREFWKARREFECQKCALYEKVYRDELTGLYNRYGLKEAVKQLPRDTQFAVMILDIDNMEQLNAASGRATGDLVIRSVAQALGRVTRSRDIIARIGGDDFMILLCGMSDPVIALGKGRQICATLASSTINGTDIHTRCTAGIALGNAAESYEEYSGRADTALYAAMKEGHSSCAIYGGNARRSD